MTEINGLPLKVLLDVHNPKKTNAGFSKQRLIWAMITETHYLSPNSQTYVSSKSHSFLAKKKAWYP